MAEGEGCEGRRMGMRTEGEWESSAGRVLNELGGESRIGQRLLR